MNTRVNIASLGLLGSTIGTNQDLELERLHGSVASISRSARLRGAKDLQKMETRCGVEWNLMKKGPQRASWSVQGRTKRRITRGRCGTLQRANFDKGKEKAHYRRLLSTNTNKKRR